MAVLVSLPVGIELTFFEDSILWSLGAELVYYALYPALLPSDVVCAALRSHSLIGYPWTLNLFAIAVRGLSRVECIPRHFYFPAGSTGELLAR